MKKHKAQRRLWHGHSVKLAILFLSTFLVLGAYALAKNVSHTAPPTKSPVAQTDISTHHVKNLTPSDTSQKPANPSALKTTTPAVSTPPPVAAKPAAIPAPKPADNVAASPAAVASTNATPGDGVSGLSSSTGSPAPAPPATPPPADPSTGSPPASNPTPCTNTPGRYTSTNWAGYFRTGCTFTTVSGKWTVPTPTTTSTTDITVDAAWIGIGGVTTEDLIQVGTEDIVATDGTINAAVFYELLPDAPHYPAAVTVRPGDQISASISETTPGSWLISISNLTSGKTFTKTVVYTSTHSSAEWIEEDPSFVDGTLVPFDNFGTVNFSAANTTGNGTVVTLTNANDVRLVDRQHRTLAAPSSIFGSNADSFSVVRQTP
jgi:hypothetical protein